MRKLLVACFSCLFFLLGSGVLAGAATVEKLYLEGSSHATAPSCKVVTADGNGVTLELEIPYLDKEAMEVEGTVYQLLSIPGGGFSGESGEAALPSFTRLVAIPDYVGVKVRVTNPTTS